MIDGLGQVFDLDLTEAADGAASITLLYYPHGHGFPSVSCL
jgi:hypothetical protein